MQAIYHTITYNRVENDIEQVRLNAVYKFGDDSSLEFGLENRTNDYLGRSRGDCCIVFGDWGGTDVKNVPDSFWTPRNFLADFKGYNLGTSFTQGIDYNFNEVADWVASQNGKLPNFRDFSPSGKFEAKPRVTSYRGIVEDVQGGSCNTAWAVKLAVCRTECWQVFVTRKLTLPLVHKRPTQR